MWDYISSGLWYWLLAFTPGVIAGMGIMHWAQGCAIDGNQPPASPNLVTWDPSSELTVKE